MTMICFDVGNTCFNYRVAGIALRANQVLLNRAEDQSFWFLPGGRVEMGETAIEALRREMQEEVQAEVEVGRLLWINENFFKGGEKLYHELGFYYLMSFATDSSAYCADEPFFAQEGQTRMVFQWFSLDELDHVRLYPSFLVQGLRTLPEQPVYVLVDER